MVNRTHRILALVSAFCLANIVAMPKALSETPLFDKPLFSDSLFSDDDMSASLDKDVSEKPAAPQPSQPTEASVARQITQSQVDMEFMRQIQQCSHWLQLYGVRNQGRFPGLQNDEGYAAQVQLEELVPNNPYNYGYTQTMQPGVAAWHNQNGSNQTGGPIWGDEWTEHLQAQTDNRVQLSMDFSLTPQIINDWAKDPPGQFFSQGGGPGTINCIGNGQGLFCVWGVGADGKPFRNPMNGLVYIAAGQTYATVNDQSAPNEY